MLSYRGVDSRTAESEWRLRLVWEYERVQFFACSVWCIQLNTVCCCVHSSFECLQSDNSMCTITLLSSCQGSVLQTCSANWCFGNLHALNLQDCPTENNQLPSDSYVGKSKCALKYSFTWMYECQVEGGEQSQWSQLQIEMFPPGFIPVGCLLSAIKHPLMWHEKS